MKDKKINLINDLKDAGIEFLENESMDCYSSIKTGGIGELIIFPKNERELVSIAALSKKHSIRFLVTGKGTNMLFRDGKISEPIISFRKWFANINRIEEKIKEKEEKIEYKPDASVLIKAGSAAALSQILNYAIKNSLTGCEFFYGIPGSLGGAVQMNAGSKESSMENIIQYIDIVTEDGVKLTIDKRDIQFSYRNIDLKNGMKNYFITGAALSLRKTEKSELLENIKIFKARKSLQPAGHSLGCVFKNPPEMAAGKIIDEIGLKGFTKGGAKISDKHANFIINQGKASSTDVMELIKIAQEKAFTLKGIKLYTEIKVV